MGGAQPDEQAIKPVRVLMEADWGQPVIEELRRRGHAVEVGMSAIDVRYGGYQGIFRHAGGWAAGSESRQDGCAAGY